MVNMVEENFPTSLPLTSIEEQDEPMMDENEDEEMLVIQTIMEPSRELLARIFRRGWAYTEAGNPFIVMPASTTFLDPSLLFPEEAVDNFGEVASEDVVSAGGKALDSSSFTFSAEPSVPPELQEVLKPEELEQLDQGRGLFKELEKFEWTFENKDTLMDANKLYREEMEFKGMKPQAQPRAPSDQERMLHEHTHLPFRSWCDFCVSCKSKMDAQRPVDDVPEGRREGPSMQIDYCYGKIAPEDPAVTVLVGLDCQTKMLTAMPVETKGQRFKSTWPS
eukprot:s218_g12.t1